MAPKKRNSFYFFMKEMQEKEAARGCRISMSTLPNYAHPIWAKMSIPEREPYEEMARRFKNDPNMRGGRLASDGTRLEDNMRELEEEERQENELKHSIRAYVNADCNLPVDQFKDIQSRKMFYFISFNILCKTENDYIPNEIGLIEYSIQHGIHREYHRIIGGPIPTGYTGEAKRLSEKHGIDIFGEELSERNLRAIYTDIKNFLDDQHTEEYPPLFSVEDDLEQNKGCLKWIARHAVDNTRFEVWNSKYLLMELRDGVGHTLPSPIIASDLLSKTCFNYHPVARCELHQDRDIHFCALAYSKRLCYLLSDAVCVLFDVMLTDRHIPTRSVEEKEYVVTVGNESKLYNTRAAPLKDVPQFHPDQRNNYYENDQFADAPIARPIVNNTPLISQPPPTRQHRQPATSCIAAEMTKLRLNAAASATVPGVGIGRGQRKN